MYAGDLQSRHNASFLEFQYFTLLHRTHWLSSVCNSVQNSSPIDLTMLLEDEDHMTNSADPEVHIKWKST